MSGWKGLNRVEKVLLMKVVLVGHQNRAAGKLLLRRNTETTGWGKITSLLSVGHCEGRGGRRRVGLALKVSGIREVPVTTISSRKDGVVE